MDTDETLDTAALDALLPSADGTLNAAMFVHSLAPVGSKHSQDELVERLQSLADDDLLTELDLLVWGDSICTTSAPSDVGCGERIVDAISEFYALSAHENISIAPFFRVTEVTSEYTDESFRRVVPPCRCLALYEQADLVGVFPSLVDGVAYTPEEVVTYLERHRRANTATLLADESM